MKLIIFSTILVALLLPAININAQYISNYDKNGKIKPVSQFNQGNKQNSYKPKTEPATKTKASRSEVPLTYEEREKAKKEQERQYQLWLVSDAAQKKADAAKKIADAQRLAAYNKKIAKYDHADLNVNAGWIRRVRLNKKYGYIDASGDEIIPLLYDSVSISFADERAFVKSGNRWGFIDVTGKTIIPIQYDEASNFSNGLAAVKLNGKYGYINKTGQVIIPLIYDDVKPPSFELYAVKLKRAWGFLDKTGVTKIDFQFDELISSFAIPFSAQSSTGQFSPPVAIVVKNNARFKINTTGALVGRKTDIVTGSIVVDALQTGSFTDVRDNKVYGTIKIGDQIWMSQNLDISQFAFGEQIPEAKSAKEWKRAGEKETPAWCYYNNDPENGKKYGKLYNLHAVVKGLVPNGWHIPNKEDWEKLIQYLGGEKIAAGKMKYSSGWNYGEFTEEACGFSGRPGGTRDADGKFNFIGTFGEWWGLNDRKFIFKPSYELWDDRIAMSSGYPSYGLSVRCIKNEEVILSGAAIAEYKDYVKLKKVKKKKKFGFIDESGKMAIDPVYDFASEFFKGFASVMIGNKYGFIDGTGEAIVPLAYDETQWTFAEGYVGVMLNGKWGFVDNKNNIVVPIIYEEVKEFQEGLAPVKLNSKWGFIDKTGKIVVQLIYEGVLGFFDGVSEVYPGNGERRYVNKKGEEIIRPVK